MRKQPTRISLSRILIAVVLTLFVAPGSWSLAATTTKYPQTYTPAAAAHPTPFGNTGDPDGAGSLAAGTVLWTRNDANPDSTITSANGKGWTSASLATPGAYVDLTNFGFGDTIPIGSTINSITFEVGFYRFTGTGSDTFRLGALKSGVTTPTNWGAASATAAFPTFNTLSIGGPTTSPESYTNWIQVFATNDVLTASFGVRMRAESTTTSTPTLDFVRCTIDYTEPTDPAPTGYFYKWSNIDEIFREMNRKQTHVVGMGDSNWWYNGYGHKEALEYALSRKYPIRATGLCGVQSLQYQAANGGYGYITGSSQRLDPPDTQRNLADDWWGYPIAVESCDLSSGATPTVTKTGAFAGYSFTVGDVAYLQAMSGTSGVTAGAYEITGATANALTLATSPSSGTAKTGGIFVSEINPSGVVRGLRRSILPMGMVYVADANSIASGSGYNLSVESTCPLSTTGNIRFTLWYAYATAGTGSFTLQGRNETTFATLTGGPTINPVDIVSEVNTATWDLSADSARTAASFGLTRTGGGSAAEGPISAFFCRLESRDRTTGFDCNTFFQQGGESALDMLWAMQVVGATPLNTYVDAVRNQGSYSPAHDWLVLIQTAGNDRNETVTSRGAYGVFSGSTRNAFYDNILGIITAWETALASYTENGDKLRFLICVSHPHYTIPSGSTEDSQIAGYRRAAYQIADIRSDTAVLCMQNIATSTEWQGMYAVGDNAHLLDASYDTIWQRTINWTKRAVAPPRPWIYSSK